MRWKAVPKKSLERAIRLSREFFGFDPRDVSKIKVGIPDSLVMLGTCAQLNYVCDKFDGKPREYYHRFEGAAVVVAPPESLPNGSHMIIIIGDFEIDQDGIKG